MSIAKKPYEISLWEEQLVWHRRKLEQIQIASKDDYKRGAYYVKSEALGANSYELSYEDYNEDKKPYYQLAALNENNCIEGNDSINEITHPDWYKDGQMVPNVLFSYYKETRLCTIGSDTMDSPARAVNGKLVRKVNGEVTFTFTMYYRYFDNQTGELEYNPFVPYLTNERKVKLKYDGEWYDLIVKQIQENSESKAFTYTCKSQFINELSKTGFELEFDNELENNMGTIEYLAEQILEGSDWILEGESNLKQFIEEPLYKVKIKSDATLAIKVMNPTKDREEAPSIAGKEIYVFYSHINEQQESWQFLYDESPFSTNDDLIIDKDTYPNYLIESVVYADGADWPEFVEYGVITSDYRGMRLVKQVRTIYDAKIDKYVQEYTKEGDTTGKIYYGFEETKYLSPNAVTNYAVNPNAFTSTTGWYAQPNSEGAKATLELVSDPPFNADNIGSNINFTSYLKFPNNGGALVNSSINSHKSSLEGFTEGKDRYVLRLKCKNRPQSLDYIAPSSARIGRYDGEFGMVKKEEQWTESIDDIFSFDSYPSNDEDCPIITTKRNEGDDGYLTINDGGYINFLGICIKTVTATDLKNWDKHYGLFLTFNDENIFVEEIQLFPLIVDNEKRLCVPDGELFSKVETIKRYYDPNEAHTSLEEVEFKLDDGKFVLKYAEGAEAYTKVSSITAKESNRFNLLQDLNEKFECWARFRVEHNEDGSIKLGKDCGILTGDEAYRQQKFVSFHEYAGVPNHAGFKYGINSKSIQRTLDSNAIVSKMIVKDNANEFARNGFCSIARAIDNSSKENFILNFDHYYRQNLLDLDVVTSDLYLDSNGYLGYYKKLREINRDRDALVEEQSNLLTEIANYKAQHQTYKTSYDSAIEEQNQAEDNIFLLIVPKEDRDKDESEGGAKGLEFAEIIACYSASWEDNSSYIKYATSWMQCDNVIKQHKPLYEKAERYLKACEEEYNSISNILKQKADQKRALNLQFYKKYSRFIQEGSWIKEDYIDDNLYYLDSLSTLHTSAQPKVTYNISVVDVSPLAAQEGYEDFAYYDFKLGDITYIEDREFFGYSLIDGTTPYREEIVVSEITNELDAPEKNSIKVQNYKTQFEDLFQRITAQTQQAEYHTGEYQRAASVVEPDGTISVSTLANSFSNNSFKLSNARDQSVVIDEYGITSTSLANPSEMVRIVNGGIFMSTDGGQSWKTGLTGYGLNSSYLTAGQINTDEIYIMSGNQPAFGWDEKGISAYELVGSSYNLNKCVRFDRHGIYGIANEDQDTETIDKIMESAPFALTWKGFSLKNEDGSVKITSTNDIQVLNGQYERIKIGRIGGSDNNYKYGIRISKEVEILGVTKTVPVMVTGDDGELWLENRLRIGNGSSSTVELGYLGATRGEDGPHEVIHAGASDKDFIVYEDGKVIANYIEARGGKIGNMEIASIEEAAYEVIITSNIGNSMKQGTMVELTARLYHGGEEVTENLSYQWYDANDDIANATGQIYTLEGVDFGNNGYVQYGCKITYSELKEEENGI